MVKKKSLVQLISEIQWIECNPGATRGTLNEDEICGSYVKSGTQEIINRVLFRFGKKILKELGWKIGDKILPLYNPNDVFHFKLVKSDKGYTITAEGNGCRIGFKWPHLKIELRKTINKRLEYKIINHDQVVFRMDDE